MCVCIDVPYVYMVEKAGPALALASVLRSISVSGAAGAVAPMQVSHQLRGAADLTRQHRGTLQTYLV